MKVQFLSTSRFQNPVRTLFVCDDEVQTVRLRKNQSILLHQIQLAKESARLRTRIWKSFEK